MYILEDDFFFVLNGTRIMINSINHNLIFFGLILIGMMMGNQAGMPGLQHGMQNMSLNQGSMMGQPTPMMGQPTPMMGQPTPMMGQMGK